MRIPVLILAPALLTLACADLPTSNVTTPSDRRATTFSNSGALVLASTSDCTFQSPNIVCNLVGTGLANGAYVNLTFHVDWDIPVQCVHTKTGKPAPARHQPSSPFSTYTEGGNFFMGPFSDGQYAVSNYVLYPPGLGSDYFCPKGPYVLEQGTATPTAWWIQLTSYDDSNVWGRLSS